MFEGDIYYPALSTRVHEQLAYAKCAPAVKDRMVPIVTLTRYGREETLQETASILLSDLDGRSAIVDFDLEPRPTTSMEEKEERRRRKNAIRAQTGQKPTRPRSEKELANDEERLRATETFNMDVTRLSDPRDGAVRWTEIISDFPELVPVLSHVDATVIDRQLAVIGAKGTRGAFRINPRNASAASTLVRSIRSLRDYLPSLIVIVDLQNIRGQFAAASNAASTFLAQLHEGLDNDADALETVVLSNSFPDSKTSLRDMPQSILMEEVRLHKQLSQTFPVRYGDYMSVAPRQGSSKGGNGWFPHVDLAALNTWHICLYENNSDESKYVNAAEDTVNGSNWGQRASCWGADVIAEVAASKDLIVDGKKFTVPTTWISVRANQHLTQMALSR